jgi:hypothetical protein
MSHIGAEDDTAGSVIDSPSSATILLDGDSFCIPTAGEGLREAERATAPWIRQTAAWG